MDPYRYPGTDVLKNLRDIRDPDILARFEAEATSKGGQLFGAAAFIGPALRGVLEELPRENLLRGTESFSRRAGFFLGEIHAIHPFREGNGRTQREFIRRLGLEAGFVIDWSRITRDQLIAASRASFQTGDSSGLAALILRSIC